VAEAAKQGSKQGGARDADGLGGLNSAEAAVDYRRAVTSQDGAKLLAIGFGAQNGQHLLEQCLSFPRTPNLSWLRSCCSSAAADGYLTMQIGLGAAVWLLVSQVIPAAARPRAKPEHKEGQWREDVDDSSFRKLPESVLESIW